MFVPYNYFCQQFSHSHSKNVFSDQIVGREEIVHGLVHVVKSFSAKNFVFGKTVLLNFEIKIQGGQKKRKSLKNMVNDTISDMLTRIRNANLAYKTSVSLSKTTVHEKICQILEQEGFIEKFKTLSRVSHDSIQQPHIFKQIKKTCQNSKKVA